MCGIVAYLGQRRAQPILIEGLKRLEYRGYDSAGVAIRCGQEMRVVKAVGRIMKLEAELPGQNCEEGTLGIGHTRWATHGGPSQENAHPHLDSSGRLAVVHNGIIENHAALRKLLEQEGVEFRSETDSEVLPHLFAKYYRGNLADAVRQGLKDIRGTYGIAVVHADNPGVLVAARNGSPLIVGVGDGEFLVASDASAIIAHTTRVVYLEDREVVVITRDGFETSTIDAVPTTNEIQEVEWDLAQIEKKGYAHFMLKEIFEQPESLADTMRGRLDLEEAQAVLGGLQAFAKELTRAKRIILTGCGTAWHAALIGEYMFEDLARVPVEVEYASEFRYRNPIIG
ncbi:MAG: glutamine--fructose-6-phosphate transaminase (isomerizing), partial [Anaerolineaceae bacterium]|nr:glutamine--fructose-6-phosphate transaminase (isomerizing) [Anaerolineaceae bacterium]